MAEQGRRDRGPYKRSRRGDSAHHQKQKKGDEKSTEPVVLTPALKLFKEYQTELDGIHDKYERLVKISRDVTIESKRIIFLLHRIEGDPKEVLEEAEGRLATLQDNLIAKIAYELKGEDVHRFLRAFSPGLQEYIEAVAFYLFIKEERLMSFEDLSARLTFPDKQPQENVPPKTGDKGSEVVPSTSTENDTREKGVKSTDPVDQTVSDKSELKTETVNTSSSPPVSLNLPPLEVMLGLADFTGELMRLCINTVGSGDLERPFELLPFMRAVSEGFQFLGNQAGREMLRKASVMRQSLKKMEDACYVIKVRGSEIPKHMLKDAIVTPSEFSDRDGRYDHDVF